MGKDDLIQVGIVGAGRVGVDWHLPDIREAGGGVMALADCVPGRAARYAEQSEVPHAFEDYHELLEMPGVEIVAVCTPPVSHEEIAVAAFEAGKHVYLEKPPAMNEAEMVRITRAGHEAERLLFSGSNNIYNNKEQTLKRLIDGRQLGDLYAVECTKLWRRNIPKGWHRRRAISGGGPGMDSAPHRLDLVLYLLDTPGPVSVTARTYDRFRHLEPPRSGYLVRDAEEGIDMGPDVSEVEDFLTAFIQFDNGVTCTLRDTAVAHGEEHRQFRVFGSQAGATLDPPMIYSTLGDGTLTDTGLGVPEDPSGAHVNAYRHFFRCIREGRDRTASPGERSIVLMRIVDAIYESAANGGRQVQFEG